MLSNATIFYTIQNKKMWIWIFMICEKIQKIIIGYRARLFKNYFPKISPKKKKTDKKIANAIARTSNNDKIVKQEPVEEIIIPP